MAELQDVIKGLKCGSCATCPYYQIKNCSHAVKRDAIKLIESQQAEIERLKGIAKKGNGFIEKCDSRTAQMFSH